MGGGSWRVRIGNVSFIFHPFLMSTCRVANIILILQKEFYLQSVHFLYHWKYSFFYNLGPSSHGDRSGIWKCISSYHQIAMLAYRHISSCHDVTKWLWWPEDHVWPPVLPPMQEGPQLGGFSSSGSGATSRKIYVKEDIYNIYLNIWKFIQNPVSVSNFVTFFFIQTIKRKGEDIIFAQGKDFLCFINTNIWNEVCWWTFMNFTFYIRSKSSQIRL